MHKVFLEGLEVHAYHGVTTEEKFVGHRLVADVVLEVEGDAPQSDRVEDTVDYATLAKRVSDKLTGSRFATLERVATLVCEDLLATFEQAEQVSVRLWKSHPPMPIVVRAAGVEVAMRRQRENRSAQ